MRRPHRDRGTVALFTTIFAMFVLILAGLLVDGGLTIHARQRAADIAEQAARAAADTIDVAYLRRTGKARILASSAPCRRARLLASKYPEVSGPIQCDTAGGESARVIVQIHVKFQLLSAFGFSDMTMSSSASAHPQEGI
ncbi:pilus assembly protein TadG-related protein [Actinomadura sp. DC4]|uniref:pilus assembly protein TadG-related protein n=1 Tax=Actinomadura sp. DC4 TaxID=3055069 RepID=UPI0025B19472|nr:pilus assembly protein TadG-related protein [Actinomadura sp. DC4]MDN3357067.1 pilus assembly protein TadG-related protein [Actinomadura sp. DC4]